MLITHQQQLLQQAGHALLLIMQLKGIDIPCCIERDIGVGTADRWEDGHGRVVFLDPNAIQQIEEAAGALLPYTKDAC